MSGNQNQARSACAMRDEQHPVPSPSCYPAKGVKRRCRREGVRGRAIQRYREWSPRARSCDYVDSIFIVPENSIPQVLVAAMFLCVCACKAPIHLLYTLPG